MTAFESKSILKMAPFARFAEWLRVGFCLLVAVVCCITNTIAAPTSSKNDKEAIHDVLSGKIFKLRSNCAFPPKGSLSGEQLSKPELKGLNLCNVSETSTITKSSIKFELTCCQAILQFTEDICGQENILQPISLTDILNLENVVCDEFEKTPETVIGKTIPAIVHMLRDKTTCHFLCAESTSLCATVLLGYKLWQPLLKPKEPEAGKPVIKQNSASKPDHKTKSPTGSEFNDANGDDKKSDLSLIGERPLQDVKKDQVVISKDVNKFGVGEQAENDISGNPSVANGKLGQDANNEKMVSKDKTKPEKLGLPHLGISDGDNLPSPAEDAENKKLKTDGKKFSSNSAEETSRNKKLPLSISKETDTIKSTEIDTTEKTENEGQSHVVNDLNDKTNDLQRKKNNKFTNPDVQDKSSNLLVDSTKRVSTDKTSTSKNDNTVKETPIDEANKKKEEKHDGEKTVVDNVANQEHDANPKDLPETNKITKPPASTDGKKEDSAKKQGSTTEEGLKGITTEGSQEGKMQDNKDRGQEQETLGQSNDNGNIKSDASDNAGFDTGQIQLDSKKEISGPISKKFEYTDSHFFTYFLTIVVLCIIVYLVFHNKQKIIALIIEGRHPQRKRPNTTNYKKLDSNLEEVMQSSTKATTSSHVIF